MKIIIDSNRVIASLIKDSTTREIMFDKYFDFSDPDFILQEIYKHKNHVLESSEITDEEFEILLALIFERISIIAETEYKKYLDECESYIKDMKDIPYIAACLATNADGIWTHDPHFQEQNKVKIFTNIDMLKISGKINQN